MNVPHDNEWLKIVASTCLGLIAGLVAEPLKNVMTGVRTRREIGNAIRADLKFIRAVLPILRLNKYDAKHVSSRIELPAFEHYWETSKGSFYTSIHLHVLRWHCDLILSEVRKMDRGQSGKLESLSSIEESIEAGLKSKEPNSFQKVYYNCRRWLYYRSLMPTIRNVVFTDEDGKAIPEGDGSASPIPAKTSFKRRDQQN
ncbi:MAG: hypothetical protein WCA10_05365 [Terracidiphilus sp.]